MSRLYPRVLVGLTLLMVCSASRQSMAGPKVVVGRLVSQNQRLPMDSLDHSSWNALLGKYVDELGNVDYTGWKRSAQDTRILDQYLAHLSRSDRRQQASKQARLAMWINAYNAVTIRGILREYPTASIRNHTAKLYGYNIWKDLLLQVGDQQFSLDQIEHDILRKMGEPRIHFAIVCASLSCPKLRYTAFDRHTLERQLTENAVDFFSNPANFRYDPRQQKMYLSSILDWFGEDFGRTKVAQLKAIAPYLPDDASKRAAESGSVSVSYLSYDWSLNDQKFVRTARQ